MDNTEIKKIKYFKYTGNSSIKNRPKLTNDKIYKGILVSFKILKFLDDNNILCQCNLYSNFLSHFEDVTKKVERKFKLKKIIKK